MISRRLLTVTVLLLGTLMAVSEAPEILTLTDNTSNDYEVAVEIARAHRPDLPDDKAAITHSTPPAAASEPGCSALLRQPCFVLPFHTGSALLLLLTTQRK